MLLQVCYYWQHHSSGLYQQPGRNSRWSLQGICGCCAWTGISTLQQYICQEPTQPREILEQHRLKSWHSGCPDCPPMTHFGDQTLMHKLQMCFSKTKAMKCYSNLLVAQVLSGVNSPSSENVVPNTSEHACSQLTLQKMEEHPLLLQLVTWHISGSQNLSAITLKSWRAKVNWQMA